MTGNDLTGLDDDDAANHFSGPVVTNVTAPGSTSSTTDTSIGGGTDTITASDLTGVDNDTENESSTDSATVTGSDGAEGSYTQTSNGGDTDSTITTDNDITGADTVTQTDTVTNSYTRYGSGYTQTDDLTQTTSTTGPENSISGVDTPTVIITIHDVLGESGSDGAVGYSFTLTTDSTDTQTGTTNSVSGDVNTSHTFNSTSTLIENGGAGDATYTLNQSIIIGQDYSETGNSVSGDFNRTGSESRGETNNQTSTSDTLTTSYIETQSQDDDFTDIGNSISGADTLTQIGTRGSTLIDNSTLNGVTFTVQQISTGPFNRTEISNSITGADSITETSSSVYWMSEVDVTDGWTIIENGTLTVTSLSTQIGNTLTGAYTQTELATDGYTITETGTLESGPFIETVTGTDNVSQTEIGNTLTATYTRTTIGGGDFTIDETGGTIGSGSGTNSYTLTENANQRSGNFSQSEIGTDRYGLLEQFANLANTNGSAAPGHLDFHPFGLAYVDPVLTADQYKAQEAQKARQRIEYLQKEISYGQIGLKDTQYDRILYPNGIEQARAKWAEVLENNKKLLQEEKARLQSILDGTNEEVNRSAAKAQAEYDKAVAAGKAELEKQAEAQAASQLAAAKRNLDEYVQKRMTDGQKMDATMRLAWAYLPEALKKELETLTSVESLGTMAGISALLAIVKKQILNKAVRIAGVLLVEYHIGKLEVALIKAGDAQSATDIEHRAKQAAEAIASLFGDAAMIAAVGTATKSFEVVAGAIRGTKKAPSTKPEPKPEPAPNNPIRTDGSPYSTIKTKGGARSYIDAEGNLRPANPDGKATIQQHIRGSDPAKADSPYTSFSENAPGAKVYGDTTITLDKARLQADIASGKVTGVKIIEHNEVIKNLSGKVNEAQARYDTSPTQNNLDRVNAAKQDLQNATRDKEILIQGIVPKGYITVSPP